MVYNAAKDIELPSGRAPKPLVWTHDRVARWQRTGERPGPAMVWTPRQTGTFLDAVAHDRLYPLLHLAAFRGLRRGELCGLHWTEVDLEGATAQVQWQIVLLGWGTQMTQPKSEASKRQVALDAETVAVLRSHREGQDAERSRYGSAWVETGLVFTRPGGTPLHPAEVTHRFTDLIAAHGLPPIRFHDLRHGAATLALGAGVDLKVVQEMLGHSSHALTADIYTSVLPELARAAAEAAARLVPRTPPVRAGHTSGTPEGIGDDPQGEDDANVQVKQGALGGTRTPNLLIRSSGRTVYRRPRTSSGTGQGR